MRNPGGYATIVNPDGHVEETDTFTCTHCNQVVFVKPATDPTEMGGFCLSCMRHICGPCADLGRCTPFEKKIEQMEARERLMKAIMG